MMTPFDPMARCWGICLARAWNAAFAHVRGRVTCAALVLLFLGTLVSESTNSKKCFSGGRGGRGRCYCVSFTLLCVIRRPAMYGMVDDRNGCVEGIEGDI